MVRTPSAKQPISLTPVLPGQRSSSGPGRRPLTELVGREEVLERICEILDADNVRLLTLTGPGGIGKTRIALEVAFRLESDYAHGVWFVPLAPVLDAEHVLPAVAQVVGTRAMGDVPVADALASALRERHMLLVLDNFEHVVDAAAPWLAGLVAGCPRLTVLVTSRAALNVSGERRYSIPPLSAPAQGSVSVSTDSAAVRLFVTRAVAARHDFGLDASNAGAIGDICHQLDGIPLAIELAAARINVLSPKDILGRLPDRLALLADGDRDLPSRHQTMRGCIAWSHDLLSEPEQWLFRRLSVFVGGFTLDAAESIGREPGLRSTNGEIVDVLASLVDHSLIRHEASGSGEPRFWMLETIRQFGLERLAVHGEEDQARDAHAAWCLRLGENAEIGLEGGEQVRWFNRIQAEHPNIHSVFIWLFGQERIEDAADLGLRLICFRMLRGGNREFRPYQEAMLAHSRLAGPVLARGKALVAMAPVLLGVGDTQASLVASREAASILRNHGERGYESMALGSMGIALLASDDLAGATAMFEESIALGREESVVRSVSAGLGSLGIIAWIQGRMDDALELQEQALRVARDGQNTSLISEAIGHIGDMAFGRGDYDQAESLFRESMILITALGNKRDMPYTSLSLAKIARIRGDYATARGHINDALTVAREVGDLEEIAQASMASGRLASMLGQPVDAVRALRQSIAAFEEWGSESGLAGCLDVYATVAIRTRDVTSAARMIGAADAARARIGIARTEGPQQREHLERMSAVRSALGEAAFLVAYDAGRTMALDQAVADALAFEPSVAARNQDLPGAAVTLSPRELEVLRLMADGLTNREISAALCISNRTATSHASNVLGKLGLDSRTAAVAFAIRNGLA
ncbi:MAG: tetratricopeptide repeat protein [Chloroflexia bacterium]|nr:tetratricopeptide repeat protein [Chloroflexia bacterium]